MTTVQIHQQKQLQMHQAPDEMYLIHPESHPAQSSQVVAYSQKDLTPHPVGLEGLQCPSQGLGFSEDIFRSDDPSVNSYSRKFSSENS